MAVIETLEVLEPGPMTTIQDLGRYGFGRYGVPPSGALDPFALRAANLLVGNPEGEAGLEITFMGLKVKALTSVLVAIGGGDLQPAINGEPIVNWRSHTLKAGDTLSFKAPRNGCRAYLAVGGGIVADPVLGSKSTNLSSRFGGCDGRPMKRKDVLFSEAPETHLKLQGKSLPPERVPFYGKEWMLRVLLGPQESDFTASSQNTFLASSFKVSTQSDRTGIRLSGPPIRKKDGQGESIISEGVVQGAVQIPGDGQPIIILTETVTGGYRKIATVISADLPFLAQIKPGDEVTFVQVDLVQAIRALEELEDRMRRFRDVLTNSR